MLRKLSKPLHKFPHCGDSISSESWWQRGQVGPESVEGDLGQVGKGQGPFSEGLFTALCWTSLSWKPEMGGWGWRNVHGKCCKNQVAPLGMSCRGWLFLNISFVFFLERVIHSANNLLGV